MTTKTYLEYTDETSSKFWELTLDGSEFTVRYGKIGSDGRENTKSFDSAEEAREAADKLIASKTKKGYAAPKDSASNPEPTQISFADAVERYEQLKDPGIEPLADMAGTASVYAGDVTWDGYSITGLAAERGEMGTIIIIDGDLTLTDDSVSWDRDQEFENNVLLVTGNLKANGLCLIDIGAVQVDGDLEVKALMGAYGDNGGSLNVSGHTTAGLIIASTYFMFGFAGGVSVGHIIGDSTYATDWTDDYIDTEEVERFVDEVHDGDEAEPETIYDRFLAGQPILK